MEDLRIKNFVLLESPQQAVIVTATYLFLVVNIGPFIMEKRQRFDLTVIIRVYNILQIIFNGSIFVTGAVGVLPDFNMWWSPSDEPDNETIVNVEKLSRLYLMLKVFDLVETMFFILRKKPEQVSFLHVFHHVGIFWMTWAGCKYFRAIYGFIPAGFNLFAHFFMYIYYLQSSWGKVPNKFWKRCLTTLQIGHQVMVFVLFGLLLVHTKCPYSQLYLSLSLGYMIVIIYLFLTFYKNNYVSRNSSKAS